MKPGEIKLIEIDNPYRSWDDPLVQNLFLKMITLKFNSYKAKYPDGVIPVDTSDWVSKHFLACKVEGRGNYVPLMGFRLSTLQRCREHYLGFPPLLIAKSANAVDHVKCIEQIIAECDQKKLDLSYVGAFTVDLKQKSDPEFFKFLRHMMPAVHYFYRRSLNGMHQDVTAAVVRFHMDEFFRRYGFQNLGGEKTLPTIRSPYLAKEEVRFVHMKHSSAFAEKTAPEYERFWNERLIIDNQQHVKKAA